MNSDKLDELERLSKLRDAGTLTAEEFEKEKKKVLDRHVSVPFYRRLWFVVLLTLLVLTFPVALLILLTGNVYRKSKESGYGPIGKGPRLAYAGALAIWLIAAVIYNLNPAETLQRTSESNTGDSSAADNSQGVEPGGFLHDFSIEATDYNDCMGKGSSLIPSGTSAGEIEAYCEKRYVLHADCTQEELTGDALKIVRLELRAQPLPGLPDHTEIDLFITNLSRTKWLMDVTFLAQDGEVQRPVERDFGVGGLEPGKTDNQGFLGYTLPSGGPGSFKSFKLLKASMCQP